jgi:hypothetical protein
MTAHDQCLSTRHDSRPGLAGINGLLAWATRLMTDRYRPELHYMRGPGPKWRAKHGLAPAPDARPRPTAVSTHR